MATNQNIRQSSVFQIGPDVAGIAHDISSPLSIIKGFFETFEPPNPNDADAVEYFTVVRHSVLKIMGLVDEMRKPAEELRLRRHDIVKIVQKAIDEAELVAMGKKINIRYCGLKNLVTIIDGFLIGRVVSNLLKNAVQACEEGGNISVSCNTCKGNVSIEVTDDGCGIDEAHVNQIFKRGFTFGKKDGTGIGLDLCKRIIEQHGGKISVFSQKGIGATFTVEIPRRQVAPVAHNNSLYPIPANIPAGGYFYPANYSVEDTLD